MRNSKWVFFFKFLFTTLFPVLRTFSIKMNQTFLPLGLVSHKQEVTTAALSPRQLNIEYTDCTSAESKPPPNPNEATCWLWVATHYVWGQNPGGKAAHDPVAKVVTLPVTFHFDSHWAKWVVKTGLNQSINSLGQLLAPTWLSWPYSSKCSFGSPLLS